MRIGVCLVVHFLHGLACELTTDFTVDYYCRWQQTVTLLNRSVKYFFKELFIIQVSFITIAC